MGGFVVYASGLWNQLDRVLGMPRHAITIKDLSMAAASFVVLFGCGWARYTMGKEIGCKNELERLTPLNRIGFGVRDASQPKRRCNRTKDTSLKASARWSVHVALSVTLADAF
jgi:hypothetical protein